jgi:hypothetical protein
MFSEIIFLCFKTCCPSVLPEVKKLKKEKNEVFGGLSPFAYSYFFFTYPGFNFLRLILIKTFFALPNAFSLEWDVI